MVYQEERLRFSLSFFYVSFSPTSNPLWTRLVSFDVEFSVSVKCHTENLQFQYFRETSSIVYTSNLWDLNNLVALP